MSTYNHKDRDQVESKVDVNKKPCMTFFCLSWQRLAISSLFCQETWHEQIFAKFYSNGIISALGRFAPGRFIPDNSSPEEDNAI
jgi:hypothetical protein